MRRTFLPALLCLTLAATAAEPIALWPGTPPGDTVGLPPEADTTKPTDGKVADKPVIRTGNVSTPTLTFFPAPADKNTGTTVLVCPGGGYNILAWDLEGTEVCDWLNSIGVNAALLKYRVPRRPGREPHAAPLQDAQRALGILRQRAAEWKIAPDRIGILGFSAGGNLAAFASTNSDTRTYDAIDEADKLSCRPDFTILIYPAYLIPKDAKDLTLAPEIKVTAQTPPAFIAMTQDDPIHVENAHAYALALKAVKVPAEAHIYPNGGHGYGLRPGPGTVTTWPARAEEWMRARGLLERAK
jgi:acetyl esterase/lipase